MPNPKNFSVENAEDETFQLDPNDNTRVLIYRFGDRTKPRNWSSWKRTESNGNFMRPSNSELNDWAIKQSSYGSKSENAKDNPFISVATDPASLYNNGEIWVQQILQETPDMGVFSVPFDRLFRPSPTKSVSKMETEWLFYDGDDSLTDYLVGWQVNPYLA